MDSTQKYWLGKARLVAGRWNFAAWLNLFLRFAIAACFVMMCSLLVIRRAQGSPAPAWRIFAGVMLLGAGACYWLARKKFCASREALVRLDASLKLHNRLTAAADGVGGWPARVPDDSTPDGLRWRWERVLAPPLACMAVLFFAAYVPIPAEKADDQHHKEEPLAWTHIESQLETLKKQDFVNQESIVTLEQQVDQLRSQPPKDWYSHSSMEAGDSLQSKTNEAIRALKRDMETTLNTLDTAEQDANSMSEEQLQKLAAQYQQALQGLELGTLPLNKEMLNQMKNIDPNQLKNLTQQQLQQLQQNLQKGITGAASSLQQGDGNDLTSGSMQMPGSGGPGGGGPPAPLAFKPDPTNLKTKTTAPLASDDLSHAAAGDNVGVSKSQHEVDPSKYTGPASAGTIISNGAGGEAVWKNDLTPQEREVLERFYK